MGKEITVKGTPNNLGVEKPGKLLIQYSVPAIIATTAAGADDIESQCRAAGADDCVRKPYDSSDLLNRIHGLLEK